METPVGLAFLFFSAKGLERLVFGGTKDLKEGVAMGSTPETEALPEGVLKIWHDQITQAVDDYFAGKPASFEALPLDLQGSPFQLRVWQELQKIPRGETVSYQELAKANPGPPGPWARPAGPTPSPSSSRATGSSLMMVLWVVTVPAWSASAGC